MNHYIPNTLTILRIILTPFFIYFLFWGDGEGYTAALIVFIIAGITDIYDGKLARQLQVESSFGKILDPLADKILVLSAFISFVTLDLIYAWMVAVIIFRDVVITIVRSFLEYKDLPMETSNQAKSKTAIQITFIICILLYLSLRSYQVHIITDPIDRFSMIPIFMYLTVLVTLYTGLDYLVLNRASIKSAIKS
ncbi:CDP-diacylglycerol--glycerol-3-phosphate 3-phosphatidyltransferase [Candidatus Neomarinimicrobiota bacterium]